MWPDVAEFGQRGRFWGLCGRQNLAVAGWQFCGRFATCQHLLSKNRLFLEKNPKIFKKILMAWNFFKNCGIKMVLIKKNCPGHFLKSCQKIHFQANFFGEKFISSLNFRKIFEFFSENGEILLNKYVGRFCKKCGRFWELCGRQIWPFLELIWPVRKKTSGHTAFNSTP